MVLKISLKDILFFIFNKKLEEFCFYISFLHVSITLHKIKNFLSLFHSCKNYKNIDEFIICNIIIILYTI